jgi:hypothetical protein
MENDNIIEKSWNILYDTNIHMKNNAGEYYKCDPAFVMLKWDKNKKFLVVYCIDPCDLKRKYIEFEDLYEFDSSIKMFVKLDYEDIICNLIS